ncbi:MAG: Gfo/Idh/MocA family protein [Eubacteriales bacterium]
MRQIRTAIIGQGRSGRSIHGNFFLSDLNDKYLVVAAVDAREDRRCFAKDDMGCETYADYRELLNRDDIDLVVNASFSYQHYPITLDLLEHGFNVVVEKPFSMRKEDCQGLIDTAKDKGVMLNVFQQSRFAPYFERIKEIIASGVLGRLYQVSISFNGFTRRWDWQCSQRMGGGNLLNTGPHPMDQALDLLGFDEHTSLAFSKMDRANTSGDAEDFCKVILTAPDKPIVDIEISSCCAYSPYIYVIHAKYGSLCATADRIQYKYYDHAQPQPALQLEPLADAQGHPVYCTEKLEWHEFDIPLTGNVFREGTKKYYDMIYENLVHGTKMAIEPWQSMLQIGLSEQAHKDNPIPILF